MNQLNINISFYGRLKIKVKQRVKKANSYRMQYFLILPITFIFFSVSFSQNSWDLEDYSKWNHTNFRQNQIFNQPFSSSTPDYLLLDAVLFYMTNEERYKVGIAPMEYHKLLEVAAYNHSLKMATNSFFSHQNPIDGSRYSTTDRGKLAGISNPSFAENIAYNFPGNGSSYIQVASKLMTQWMNSSGHKENILSTNGRQMAAGTYYYDKKIYGTQVFQWFSNIIENPNGGVDPLPKLVLISSSTNNTTVNYDNYPKSQTITTNANQVELNELKNKVDQLNSLVSVNEGTIAKLNRDISTLKSENYRLESTNTNLTNSVNTLQQQQLQKDAQYNNLQNEFKQLSERRKSTNKNKYNKDEFHALTFKIALNTFYPSIHPISQDKFNSSLLSFGAETMLGFNFGDSHRRNSLGFTLRVNQTNRFLTQALDSNSLQPIQFYDTELTTVLREWLSFGVGTSFLSTYGSSSYQILPSASLGLCLGPKNWKIQLTQQASVNSNKKIFGRASIGIALRI
jgi:hypothetical protein